MLCTACTFQGPGATRTSHLAYNDAVQASEQGELLLNLVRLRYLDSDAWLAVPYRQHWFYIDAADLNSRRTFGLLTSLLRLEISAADTQSPPVLTLPVSR